MYQIEFVKEATESIGKKADGAAAELNKQSWFNTVKQQTRDVNMKNEFREAWDGILHIPFISHSIHFTIHSFHTQLHSIHFTIHVKLNQDKSLFHLGK